MMTLTILSIESLLLVAGGADQPASSPTPPARREQDDARADAREKDHDAQIAWERRHPFSAMLCQGDPDCLRNGGMP